MNLNQNKNKLVIIKPKNCYLKKGFGSYMKKSTQYTSSKILDKSFNRSCVKSKAFYNNDKYYILHKYNLNLKVKNLPQLPKRLKSRKDLFRSYNSGNKKDIKFHFIKHSLLRS